MPNAFRAVPLLRLRLRGSSVPLAVVVPVRSNGGRLGRWGVVAIVLPAIPYMERAIYRSG